MDLGSLIRQRRKGLHLTQDQVATRVGISKPYLSNIETGKVKNPPSDRVLRRLEQVLDFPSGQLQGQAHLARTPADIRQQQERLRAEVERLRAALGRLAKAAGRSGRIGALARRGLSGASNVSAALASNRAILIINKVAAGYPQEFTDLDYPPGVADEYVRAPDVTDRQAFAARVVGDSMLPKYREGDVVIFAPNTAARSGDDCFVRFAKDNSTTFKRLYLSRSGKIRLEALNDKYPPEEYEREEINGLWPAVMRIERIRPT
jgi:SOS-response transcriptional repressor LexA